jgi:hypothetical protein
VRVIFLDFDGVLNSREWFIKNQKMIQSRKSILTRSREQLDPAAVKLVSDFALEKDADTVISSTWRRLHTLKEINAMLKARGWQARLPFDVTPKTDEGFRGDEVNRWLWDNRPIHPHVIFDDDGDFHPDQPIVQTTFEFGITEAHIDIARGILL